MPSTDVRSLALVGTRGHYSSVLKELVGLPHVRLTAISHGECNDALTHVTDWCAKNGHTPERYDDWRSILDLPIDAVVICGPFELHAAMAIEFIQRGIHVMVEKPAALEMADLQRLRETCAQHPDVHFACMNFIRYDAGFYTAHQLISQNAIGRVRLINARKSYRFGKRPEYQRHRQTYGSTLLWVGCHAIDWALWYADSPVRAVHAFHSSAHNDDFGDFERSAICNLQFESDAMASISVDVYRPDAAPSHGDDWARVVGTEGVLEARHGAVTLIDANGPRDVPLAVDRKPVQDFLDHIAGKRKAIVNVESSLAMSEACLLARNSADANALPSRS